MPMIKQITTRLEQVIARYQQARQQAEMERRTEFQYAREMRARSEYGTPEYYYYNRIVREMSE